ncbi:major facilitator superfamily domain-containing protein [Armillaria borealis]|uniref:Major facilitator superfamily domain-containing protein n=1 Tax=Armillaria borealis TaxID=47425 RepID=A0AA39JVT3_9AGAR|nr:major facilitator superfamily domain-containing protein [Armillaria borealis]
MGTTAERKLVWKIDLILMPVLTVAYGLQFYDKAVLGSASVFGIIEDLPPLPNDILRLTLHFTVNMHRHAHEYLSQSTYILDGYIVGVLPIALILQRVPLVKTLSAFIFLWGVICMLTVAVTSYPGLVVQRIFLGMVESAVSPGFLAITALWYTKQEQTARLGIWYSATGIFSMFSGLINYGLGHASGKLATWKYMYLFAGSWTILWSIVVLLVIPSSPNEPGRWFTEEEKVLLKQRLASNMTGKDQTQWKWDQILESIRDIKLWIFLLCASAIYWIIPGMSAYTVCDQYDTVLVGGAMTCLTIWISGWFAGRYKNIRTYLLPITCWPMIIGAVMVWKGSWIHRALPLWGYYLVASFGAPYVLVLSLAAANVAGGTKKAICSGMIFIGYNVGNIIGGYIVLTPEAHIHYKSTWIAIIVCMCFVSVASLVLRYILNAENRRRDDLLASSVSQKGYDEASKAGDQEEKGDKFAFEDLTDFQQKDFRYVL